VLSIAYRHMPRKLYLPGLCKFVALQVRSANAKYILKVLKASVFGGYTTANLDRNIKPKRSRYLS
jgi:hypothetical protein